MGDRFHQLPSPAMALAFLALLAALGGTAVALPGKNTVKKDDIAPGAVNTSDLKNGAVTGAKVRNRSLTGRKFRKNAIGGAAVKESSLAKVPSAASADSAGSATNAVRAQSAGAVDGLRRYRVLASSSATNAVLLTAQAAAAEVPLYTVGPFDIYGKCFTQTGLDFGGVDTDIAQVNATSYIRTRLNGSVFDADEGRAFGEPFLNPDTAEDVRDLDAALADDEGSLPGAGGSDDDNATFGASAPDGTVISGQAGAYAKIGELPGGNGFYGPGSKCLFVGHVIG